jgi:hypothetical protein
MKIKELIQEMLVTKLKLMTEQLIQFDQSTRENIWYLKAGKAIEEISNKYPCCYEDAEIIYEEWAKGVLSECRPSAEDLREYAKHNASPTLYRLWKKNRW